MWAGARPTWVAVGAAEPLARPNMQKPNRTKDVLLGRPRLSWFVATLTRHWSLLHHTIKVARTART